MWTFRTLTLLSFLVAALISHESRSQLLGGMSDPSFLPEDTAQFTPNLHFGGREYRPAPNGGLFFFFGEPILRPDYIRDSTFLSYSFHQSDRSGRIARSIAQGSPSPWWAQQYISVIPHFLDDGNRYFITTFSGPTPACSTCYERVDSVNIKPDDPSEATPQFIRSHTFYVQKPGIGDFRTGIVPAGTNRIVFWLTRNLTHDTRIHNSTYLKRLDSSGAPLPQEVNLEEFRGQKAWFRDGKLYVLGRRVVNNEEGITQIRVLDPQTLTELPAEFPNLPQDLVSGSIQILRVLGDGKILLAGDVVRNGVSASQALRLMPDGSLDPQFAPTVLTGDSPTRWDLDATGTLRAATCVKPAGQATIARIATVLPNGSLTLATQSLNPHWPMAKALMYHPDFQAFLFETTSLTGHFFEASSASVYRSKVFLFYVRPGVFIRPMVPIVANSLNDRFLYIHGNPAYPKFYGFGDFSQIQNHIYPKLARFHRDGQVDTTFKPVTTWSKADRDWFIDHCWEPSLFVTPKGRVLIANSVNTLIAGPDVLPKKGRVIRIDSTGMVDQTYSRPRTNRLVRLPNGEFLGAKSVVNGVPTDDLAFENGAQIRIIRLNAEGDSVSEYGNYTLTFTTTDTSITSSTMGRSLNRMFTDNAKGLWMDILVWNPNNSSWATNYAIRFDSNGIARIFPRAPFMVKTPMKVEVLPGNRFRITGLMNARYVPVEQPDTAFFNQIELDSVGNQIPGTRRIFNRSDGFRGWQKFVVQPLFEQSDKKVLAYFLPPNTVHFSVWLVRYLPNFNLDKSFVPIQMGVSDAGRSGDHEIINQGHRIVCSNPVTFYSPHFRRGFGQIGPVRKNGLYGFRLNSAPAKTVFASGRVMQVPGPASGCNPTNPRPTASMFLRSTPGNQLAISDTGGYYTFPLTTGSHAIRQSITNEFLMRQICPLPANPAREVNLNNPGTVSFGNDFINQTFLCPRLELTIVQPRFRLCSRSRFTMNYSNSGMAAQPNARIRLNLPPEVRIEFASQAFVKDADSSYMFDLGTLQPGASGSILIRDTLLCPTTPDSLARACFSARIEPLALCGDIDPPTLNWDGAWLDATARYIPAQQQVRIAIYNRGSNMADSTAFSLSRPGLPILEGKIKLAANDSVVFFRDPALQGSIQLLLNQPANCPLGSRSGLSHSGSGLARSFLNFGNGLWERHTVQACPSWRFSYDPNEKVVEPAGEVEPGTDFTYTIHFENYGNDTAYYVAVVDSLPSQLDVSTIRLGGSSHPYTLLTAGTTENPILTFLFNPIKLTGKKQDSVLSKGQLTFSIRMKESTPRGETVSNRAHIYFDRNPAVITEYVHSKVRVLEGTTRVETSLRPSALELTVWPNPSSGTVRVGFNQMLSGRRTIQLTTVDGRVLSSWQTEGGLKELPDLKPGWYLLSSPGVKAQKVVVTR